MKGHVLFLRGDNCKTWKYIDGISPKPLGPISNKLGTKQPGMMGIQICLNEGPHFFPSWEYSWLIHKKHWRMFKIFFSTTGPISTNFHTKHPSILEFCSNKTPYPFSRGDNCSFKPTCYMIIYDIDIVLLQLVYCLLEMFLRWVMWSIGFLFPFLLFLLCFLSFTKFKGMRRQPQ